ncbi:hypothetical protein SUGI_0253150 [Cryptomeria japonica]|nr:hypothetical protein SUGI_0253150 [Cryptomeria japonica]
MALGFKRFNSASSEFDDLDSACRLKAKATAGKCPILDKEVAQPPPSKRGVFSSAPGISRSKSKSRSWSCCPICLETMKAGQGHAIFTAECSHTFHFPCIASYARRGNLTCPVCRLSWKEVPWHWHGHPQSSNPLPRTASLLTHQQQLQEQEGLRNAEQEQKRMDPILRILDESIAGLRGNQNTDFPEPSTYNDDEKLFINSFAVQREEGTSSCREEKIDIALHPEAEAVTAANAGDFTVLVHIKAPQSIIENNKKDTGPSSNRLRAPVDLVAVLDISGSMAGTKLGLLKRATSFVIGSLSPADRLSVVVFSSKARRLFPLTCMSHDGQRSARRVIDRLVCSGGTNIGDGVRKGVKILQDRHERNPVAGIMLLSDGQDTFCMSTERHEFASNFPIHAFGFGVDHDSATMHRIAEDSGGTFSFIQSESLVQDAFAQCIGGLLSVVVQDVRLEISPQFEGVELKTIHAGSYRAEIGGEGKQGTVQLGDLYAEEEKHILVDLAIPSTKDFTTDLLAVKLLYRDPVSRETLETERRVVSISRPDRAVPQRNVVVERQKNRVKTAQAISQARALADCRKMIEAQQVLRKAKAALQRWSSDELCVALQSELTEIESRMENQHTYERSGRAYALSSHSSHFRQRATTRGESMDAFTMEYQTPSMVDMLTLSQTQNYSAWKVAEKLAKVAVQRKSSTKASDLHGFEKAGF